MPMSGESQYLSVECDEQYMIARFTCPKVLERECEVLQSEVNSKGDACGWRIALDLSEVLLLASVGLGTLLQLQSAAKGKGGQFALYGANDDLMGLFKMTRLHKVLPVVKTREQAIKAIT